MVNLKNKIKELASQDLIVGTSRGVLAVQQTQRNAIKKELIEALYQDLLNLDLEEITVNFTKEGPVVGVMNDSVEEQVFKQDKDALHQSLIPLQFDIKIKNLDFDPELEEEFYMQELEAKEAKAQEKEQLKQEKIERDAAERARKAREREARIAELVAKSE